MPHQQPFARHGLDIEQEYRTIEAALLDNPRGRWFLAEHGRRARRLDTLMLEEAMGRLQSSIRQPPALLGQLQNEIEELQQFLLETRADMLARAPKLPIDATGEPPAADGILRAAEDLHELAWTLQSNDINADACEKIARQASSIYALSLRQAMESERTQKLTIALDSAGARINSLLETISHEQQIDDEPLPPIEQATRMAELLTESTELPLDDLEDSAAA